MKLCANTTCRVFDVQRFCVHDGPGIRTTVFLEGCPLRCGWCQNPEAFHGGQATALAPAEILAEVLKDQAFYDASGGGLTISGGEPLLHVEPLRALLQEAKKHGLHVCVQTSGAVPRANLSAVLGLVDLFQLDLKHMDGQRHRELTGASPERIHDNAAFLLEHGANVQLRMPVLPGVNDGARNVEQVTAFLEEHGVPELRLVPYQRLYLDKYAALGLRPSMRSLEPPSVAALEALAGQFALHEIDVEIDG